MKSNCFWKTLALEKYLKLRLSFEQWNGTKDIGRYKGVLYTEEQEYSNVCEHSRTHLTKQHLPPTRLVRHGRRCGFY